MRAKVGVVSKDMTTLTLATVAAKLSGYWQVAVVLGSATAIIWRLSIVPPKVDAILVIEHEMVLIHKQDLCMRVAEHEHNEVEWAKCLAESR